MGDHLIITDGPKSGRDAVPLRGEMGSHLTQCGMDRGLPPYQMASLSIQPFGDSTATSQTGEARQDRQCSDGTGRTILQTITQKYNDLAGRKLRYNNHLKKYSISLLYHFDIICSEFHLL